MFSKKLPMWASGGAFGLLAGLIFIVGTRILLSLEFLTGLGFIGGGMLNIMLHWSTFGSVVGWYGEMTHSNFSDGFGIIQWIILVSSLYFITGSFIGWIIGKVRNSKKIY